MKRVLLILLAIFVTTGCVRIKESSIDTLIDTTINSRYTLYNHVNSGYKYYLPRELFALVTDEYNEIIKSKYNDYYLYVDLVAYYNHKLPLYVEKEDLYYSKVFTKDDKQGIINIKEENDKYVVFVEYNFANVEVKCTKEYINECVTDSLVILSSITYNDDVIKHLLMDNDLSIAEEQVNVFDKKENDSDSLDIVDDYTGNDDEYYDPDVIN